MTCRLIVDDPADGPWNLALDEALLDACAASDAAQPVLRLYAWRPAALSLGRSQPAGSSHDAAYLRAEGIDLVRRPSGGGAVLHEHERTYAIVARMGRPPFPGGPLDAFRRNARALTAALAELGLDVRESAGRTTGGGPAPRGAACFGTAAAHEICWNGLKLVGSAQLRRRGAFLQHGSILLRADPSRLARAVGAGPPVGGFTDLASALGRAPALDRLDRALARGFAQALGQPVERGELSADERERARWLRARKYLSPAWTLAGRFP